MGKFFTTDTSDTINVAMTVQADCLDDRYTAEVQSADLKVWNEGPRLFCKVVAEIEIVDSEDSKSSAIVVVEEDKVSLPSLSKDITYHGREDFVTVESIDALANAKHGLSQIILDCLEIYVRIEGI